MSSRVNLNDNTSDIFPFTIGGLDYDLKYPTLEELEPIQELTKQKQALGEDGDTKKKKKKMEDAFYAMIHPVGHSTPIQDTIKKQPYPVVKKFNEMITEQLSAE